MARSMARPISLSRIASQISRDRLEVFAFNRHMACQNEDEIAWRCRLAEIGRMMRAGAGAAGTVLREFGHLAE